MNKFIISEEEKSRILEMHETATNKQYLSEQMAKPLTDINKQAIETFLDKIKTGSMSPIHWVLDPNNQDKRGDEVKLTGKEGIMMLNQYLNKPLLWSLVNNGKKIPNVSFKLNNTNGKILYTYIGANGGQVLYKELAPNLDKAISQFNSEVKY
jgi:hypothetical protein